MRSPFLVLFSVTVLLSAAGRAQDIYVDETTRQTMILKYRLGGFAHGVQSFHVADFGALPGVLSCCQSFTGGTATSFSGGILAEFPLRERIRIEARLGFASLSGDFSRTEKIGNEPVLEDGPGPRQTRRDVNVRHDFTSSIPLFTIEPSLLYSVNDRITAQAGLRMGIMGSTSYSQRETLIEPEGYVFLNGSTIRNQSEGQIPLAAVQQMHVIIGGRYDLVTTNSYTISPEVRYALPLSNISDVNWAVHSVQAGVSVRFGVFRPIEAVIVRDTVYKRDTQTIVRRGIVEPRLERIDASVNESTRRDGDSIYVTTTIAESYRKELPAPFDPGLSVRIVAGGDEGKDAKLTRMRVEELDVIENYPMLPQLFFAEGSADLSKTKQRLLTAAEASAFSLSMLTRDQIGVYANLLNVIGQRLMQDPSRKITVSGYCNNTGVEQGNRELSRSRAESVKTYLTSVWQIDPQRITVRGGLLPDQPANSSTPEGRVENQRVEIAASVPEVLEPIEFRDKDLIVTPPVISVGSALKQDDDIATWTLVLEQAGRLLYTAKGEGTPENVSWDASKATNKPRKDDPIIARIRVRNDRGASVEASDTVAVEYVNLQTMRARQEEGKIVERYSLIVFDFNSAQLNPANQRTMDRVKARIQPESRVRIVGYADKSGNPEYNRNLARKRCLEVQKVLGLSDERVTLEPVGSDRLIFENETPEGRSYSRTVQIELVTPVR
ncbi:MAG: OmpA family protein [Candidatus Kapabacteria bacterium]|nr:OmpA family protein [Candidatus Kapabacteria bacterium]